MYLVSVRFYDPDTGEQKRREYTYFSEDKLSVGDIVMVPISGSPTLVHAVVSTINVPESYIESFRAAVKTISSGSVRHSAESATRSKTASKIPSPYDLRIDDSEVPIDDLEVPIEELFPPEEKPPEPLNTPVDTAIISVGPQHDLSVIQLEEEILRLKNYAVLRVIRNDKDLAPVTDDLTIIAKVKKALSDKKEEYFRPIKKHLDDVSGFFNPIIAILDEADRINRQKMKDYHDVQLRHQAEAEEINRKKTELARQEAQFSGTGEITIDTTPVEAPPAVAHVSTNLGTAGFVPLRTWEEENWDEIPREYKMLDTARINRVIKSGGSIKGIRVINSDTVRITPRK